MEMIKEFKEVRTEDPIRQTWRFLRFFLDVPHVSQLISKAHDVPEGRHKENIRKQATQISYCIRQAEEYFHASSQVSLATKPTLLYYGAVSLSQALYLLRKDGTYSIDALRKEKKHNHHGLDLVRGFVVDTRSSGGVEDFFNSLQCEMHISGAGEPWGHFALFYQALVPTACRILSTVQDADSSIATNFNLPYTGHDMSPLKSFIGRKFNVFDIVRALPDMFFTLREMNIVPDIARGSMNRHSTRHYTQYPEKNRELSRILTNHQFIIDEIHPNNKLYIIDFLKQRNPNIKIGYEAGASVILNVLYDYTNEDEEPINYLPDCTDDLNGEVFYITSPDTYISEPASFLIVLYCLRMLATYYPDVWMKTIDQSVRIAETVDLLLNIAYRKFPVLILDQLTWAKHFIHS
jgi:hypothetical protein